jgi:hypothetical protein
MFGLNLRRLVIIFHRSVSGGLGERRVREAARVESGLSRRFEECDRKGVAGIAGNGWSL